MHVSPQKKLKLIKRADRLPLAQVLLQALLNSQPAHCKRWLHQIVHFCFRCREVEH